MHTTRVNSRFIPRAFRIALAAATLAGPIALWQGRAGAEVGPSSPSQFIASTGAYNCPTPGQTAKSQPLKNPYDAAPDSKGNVYIADNDCHQVYKITADGKIHVLAGTGTAGGSGDGGPATSAQLNMPDGLLLSPDESVLYIADGADHRVREVDLSTGIISGFAGTGTRGGSGDGGPAAAATLNQPFGMALSTSGDIYIADYNGTKIWKVDAGSSTIHVYLSLNEGPRQVGFDSNGVLYYAIANAHSVYKYTGSGSPSVLYDTGGGNPGSLPEAVTVDTNGNVFVGLRGVGPSGRILKLRTDGSSDVQSSVMSSTSSGCGSGTTASDLQVSYPWLMHAIGSSLFVAIGGCGEIARFGPQVTPTAAVASTFHYANGRIFAVDPATGRYTRWNSTTINGLNAMGFDKTHGNLVGIQMSNGQPHVITITSSGTVTDQGVPTGVVLPTAPGAYVAGDTDDSGHLLVRISGRSMLTIDLSTMVASVQALTNAQGKPAGVAGSDEVYLGGVLYSLKGNVLYAVDAATGGTTKQTVAGLSAIGNGEFGAGFIGAAGSLDFVDGAGVIHEISGFATSSARESKRFIGRHQASQIADGASRRP